MLEEEIAVSLIERFRILDKFPNWKLGVDELKFALMAAATPEIAVRVVNNWANYARECPKPAEIRKLVWEENEKLLPLPVPQRTASRSDPALAEKQAAMDRYIELLALQREERRLNPKLGMIGPDGMCPRTAITQELECKWAEAGMPRHA